MRRHDAIKKIGFGFLNQRVFDGAPEAAAPENPLCKRVLKSYTP
jgi:hypothetical protein